MDIIDQACEAEEWYRQEALDHAAAACTLEHVGRCYNCAEEIFAGCFCDPDCRDDYEKRITLPAPANR